MCLEFLSSSSMSQEGEGYKIVRKTDTPGVFKNFYSDFLSGWSGYTVGKNGFEGTAKTKKGCTYTLGQEYKVTHTRKTGPKHRRYRAGVHIWKEWKTVLAQWEEVMRYYNPKYGKVALVRVKYSMPVAQDAETIVALRVTVVEEIDMRSFSGLYSFND